jgi:orotidine-5'-phosphate decarboxylase
MTELIVALDTHLPEQAKAWVDSMGDRVGFYKVGMELFTGAGPTMLEWLKERGKKVFLDLKFHDIPNTAGRAVAAAARWGVDLCTIHAAGGIEMLRACKAMCGGTKLLAVTVLTSFDQEQLRAIGINRPVDEQVAILAESALKIGIDGVVCAPTDLPLLTAMPRDFLRVTPGIRPGGADVDDQKRIMTPAQAAKGGASHIVVGRPITAAPDPAAAADKILKELEETNAEHRADF